MLSVYQLKPQFQKLLRPLVIKLFNAKITANQVTIFACIGSIIIATIVGFMADHLWIFCLMPLWMFIRMALNAIDGMLAKEFHQKSNLGAYLNELCDVISDSALFLSFIMIRGINIYLVISVVILSILTEYVGVMAPLVGGSRRYDGPMGKSDRAFVFGVISAGIAINWLPIDWVNVLLAIISVLLVYTVVNRIRQGLLEVSQNK